MVKLMASTVIMIVMMIESKREKHWCCISLVASIEVVLVIIIGTQECRLTAADPPPNMRLVWPRSVFVLTMLTSP